MRNIISIQLFLSLVLAVRGWSDTIKIPADYVLIQEGIDAAQDSDTVLVDPGIYIENLNFGGKNILLASQFLNNSDTVFISETVIDGSMSGSVLTFENSEDEDAALCGFTIQNGFSLYGGGINCKNGSAPTIRHNIFHNNSAESGGAIACRAGSDCVIENNKIIDNTAFGIYSANGGGIYSASSDPLIKDNLILCNEANGVRQPGNGGGIFCHQSNPDIIGNVIKGNESNGPERHAGGGIYCFASSPLIYDNEILQNVAYKGAGIGCYQQSHPLISQNKIMENIAEGFYGRGGGMSCEDLSNLTAINNIFASNRANSIEIHGIGGALYCQCSYPVFINNVFTLNGADEGGAVCAVNSSNAVLINTISWGNTAPYCPEIYTIESSIEVSFSDIQGGFPGEGNINLDPMFVDLSNQDFRLMSILCGYPQDSPCIDSGDPAIIDSLLDCSRGLGTALSDMGAFGGGDSLASGIFENPATTPADFIKSYNYPNPFNAQTTISYTIPDGSDITLEIFDLLGRRIETLIGTYQSEGTHNISWNAGDLSTGVYFYRISANSHTTTKRLMLLR